MFPGEQNKRVSSCRLLTLQYTKPYVHINILNDYTVRAIFVEIAQTASAQTLSQLQEINMMYVYQLHTFAWASFSGRVKYSHHVSIETFLDSIIVMYLVTYHLINLICFDQKQGVDELELRFSHSFQTLLITSFIKVKLEKT